MSCFGGIWDALSVWDQLARFSEQWKLPRKTQRARPWRCITMLFWDRHWYLNRQLRMKSEYGEAFRITCCALTLVACIVMPSGNLLQRTPDHQDIWNFCLRNHMSKNLQFTDMEKYSLADRYFNPIYYILRGQTRHFRHDIRDMGPLHSWPELGDGTGTTKPENKVRWRRSRDRKKDIHAAAFTKIHHQRQDVTTWCLKVMMRHKEAALRLRGWNLTVAALRVWIIIQYIRTNKFYDVGDDKTKYERPELSRGCRTKCHHTEYALTLKKLKGKDGLIWSITRASLNTLVLDHGPIVCALRVWDLRLSTECHRARAKILHYRAWSHRGRFQ